MSAAIAWALRVYLGSDGEATKALYACLDKQGLTGAIAINLFRATKASERAKVYRGRHHRVDAYRRKEWAIDQLTLALLAGGEDAGLAWGWSVDDKQPMFQHVLYVDLPTGQVSFHTGARGLGPAYAGTWDGKPGQGADRVCRFVGRVLVDVITDEQRKNPEEFAFFNKVEGCYLDALERA